MNYCYLRVSTCAQDLKVQKIGVLGYCEKNNIFPVSFVEDTASGSLDWRERVLFELIDSAHVGDSLIVSEFTRLARSTLGVLEILNLATARGLIVHCVKENFIHDDSITSTVMATMFGLAGQIERSMISSRTKEGLRRAKARGVVLGRPASPNGGKRKLGARHNEFIALWQSAQPRSKIARMFGVHVQTLHSYARLHGIKRGDRARLERQGWSVKDG